MIRTYKMSRGTRVGGFSKTGGKRETILQTSDSMKVGSALGIRAGDRMRTVARGSKLLYKSL